MMHDTSPAGRPNGGADPFSSPYANPIGASVFVAPPPMPTPTFPPKRYAVQYGWDYIIVYTLIISLLLSLIIVPSVLVPGIAWWWWVCCSLIFLCLVYSVIEQSPRYVERKNNGFVIKIACWTHTIPFNEIAYLRLFDTKTAMINWESAHGGRTSLFLHDSVQIKSFRSGGSIVFTPKMGAREFMRNNIPNESTDDYALQRDNTEASLSHLAPVTTKFV